MPFRVLRILRGDTYIGPEKHCRIPAAVRSRPARAGCSIHAGVYRRIRIAETAAFAVYGNILSGPVFLPSMVHLLVCGYISKNNTVF
jgi:hypothetical protein